MYVTKTWNSTVNSALLNRTEELKYNEVLHDNRM